MSDIRSTVDSRPYACRLLMRPLAALLVCGVVFAFEIAKAGDDDAKITATAVESAAADAVAEAKEEATKPTTSDPAVAKQPEASVKSPKLAGIGERGETNVGDGEQLGFRQSKVAAEMRELEDRMFRLADSLQSQEPENSSRLRLGLKYSRDELIHHQMIELQKVLVKLDLSEASIEQKQLLSKLQRLQEMLLSPDLDFQMKLERLRQIREILRRLDGAIKEEDREQAQSDDAKKKQELLSLVKKQRIDLAALIQRQTEHVDTGKRLTGKTEGGAQSPDDQPAPDNASKDEANIAALSAAQRTTQAETKSFAESRGAADDPDNLGRAIEAMNDAANLLDRLDATAALPKQEQALQSLEEESRRLAAEESRLERELARERFQSMKRDQSGNRQTTESISDLVQALGERGAGALNELARATGSMSNAENQLDQANAAAADEDQTSASNSLKYAKSLLDEEAEKLLNELRSEIKKRVLEDLAMMLERQIAVRESTVVLGPRVADGSRQATNAVVALASREEQIARTASDLVAIVEETEFGIALPAALGMIRDAMVDVQMSLGAGNATDSVVVSERQIEDDIKGLMEAMKQMPGSGPPGRGRGSPSDRQRELNRLVAELKTIRMLEARLQRDTAKTDSAREGEQVAVSLRNTIESLQGRQEDIRDVTERLNAERGNELRQ